MNIQDRSNTFNLNKYGVGQPVRRTEDPVLVQGQGRYTDDVNLPGQAYAVFVRSRHGHGVIKSIDTAAAKAMPGVLSIYTGADLSAYGNMKCAVPFKNRDGSEMKKPPRTALPTDKVRYVGDPVACALQSELLEQLVRPAPRLGAREVVQASEHPEVLATGEVLVHRGVLAREPDQLPYLVRLRADVEPADARRPGVCVEQRRQDAHRRRLARAVRAEQSEDGSVAHLEVDAVEGTHLGLARPIDLDEPVCLDRCQVGKPTRASAGQRVRQTVRLPRGALGDE